MVLLLWLLCICDRQADANRLRLGPGGPPPPGPVYIVPAPRGIFQIFHFYCKIMWTLHTFAVSICRRSRYFPSRASCRKLLPANCLLIRTSPPSVIPAGEAHGIHFTTCPHMAKNHPTLFSRISSSVCGFFREVDWLLVLFVFVLGVFALDWSLGELDRWRDDFDRREKVKHEEWNRESERILRELERDCGVDVFPE